MKALQAVAVAVALAWTSAQAAEEPVKADPKKAEAKKAEPKKKTPPKKTEPKKAEPLKKTNDPNVKVYKANDPNAPQLRDKDGKVIPTSPDAYDISSALKK